MKTLWWCPECLRILLEDEHEHSVVKCGWIEEKAENSAS